MSDISENGGVPIEGEQEGKAAPLERGRGKHSPPASPKGVTERAWERRDKMVPFGLLEIFWKIETFQEFQWQNAGNLRDFLSC